MKKLIVRLALLLALALLTAGAAQCAVAEADAPVLTLMVYITGSDLESQGGAATSDILEMMYSGVDTDQVNIILCAGGSKLWQNGFPSDAVSVFQLDKRLLRPLVSLGQVSMGAPETLTSFIDYAVENYPAERYALILWDHGGGPLNGVCFDELYTKDQSHDSLDLNELRGALSASPFSDENKLEWIGFDACLMSSVETAYICAPFARYMIASQETEPGSGWNYAFLGRAGEDLTGDAIGGRIIESYNQTFNAENLMLTLSCVDLGAIEGVERAMDALFTDLDDMLGPEHYSTISNGRRDAKSFGRASTGSEYDLVDLYSLTEQYASVEPERAAALQEALDAAIVINSGNQPNSHGLSVYYPYYNKDYFKNGWKQTYGTWGFAPNYYDFLLDYSGVWLGEQMADWSNMRAMALAPKAETQEITLPLTQAQMDNFAYAKVFILGKMPYKNQYYYKVDEIDDVTLDDKGELHAFYNYEALYAVNADGEPLCDAIPYRIVDGYYLIRANLTDKTYDMYWGEFLSPRSPSVNTDATIEAHKVYLQCLPNAAGDGLEVVGIIDMREDLGVDHAGMLAEGEGLFTGKQILSVDMEGFNWVWFFHFPRAFTRDEAGDVLSFEQWPNPNDSEGFIVEWAEIDNTEPWELKFLQQQYTGRDLYAQYIVYDTQGNPTGSNLMPVANPNLRHVDTRRRSIGETDNFALTLTGIDLAAASFNDGLYLRFELEDKREDAGAMSFLFEDVMLNDCMVNDSYSALAAVDEAGNESYVLNIPSKDMPSYLEEHLESISFKLRIYDDEEYDDIERIPVTVDTDIDISDVHEYAPMPDAIAEAEASDVLYKLMGIEEDEESLTLSLYVENQGDEPLNMEFWRSTAMVDGCEWPSAVGSAWFDVPAHGWIMWDVKLYKYSPEIGSLDNEFDIPPYSYPAYWGTPVIHRLEFADWDNAPVTFELMEPYALSGMEDVTATSDGAPETLPLLATEDFEVTLTGFAVRDGALRATVDVANNTPNTLEFFIQSVSLNGANADRTLLDMNGWTKSLFSGEEVPSGGRKRYVCVIKPEGADAIEQDVETFGVRFQYRLEGEVGWRFNTEAMLGFKDGKLAAEALTDNTATLADVVLLSGGESIENPPRQASELLDVTWAVPEGATCAATLSAQLTEEQQASFESARAWLLASWQDQAGNPGLQYVTTLDAPVCLPDGRLSCDFSGLLIRAEKCKRPFIQYAMPRAEGGFACEVLGVTFQTDSGSYRDNDGWFKRINVIVDPDKREAKLDELELSREIGDAEHLFLLEYWATLYRYVDGVLEETDNMVGEGPNLDDGIIHLSVCPASDFDLVVMFFVTNQDGSEYTIAVPYAEAAGEG